MDAAAAQEVFAKRQRLGEDVIAYAHTIKIRALARLGELLKDLTKNQGAVPGKTGSKGKPVLDTTPTLADLGISKKLAAIAQQLAALPSSTREASRSAKRPTRRARREQMPPFFRCGVLWSPTTVPRSAPRGKCLVRASLAPRLHVGETLRDRRGRFIRCVCFGRVGALCAASLREIALANA